MTATNCTGSSSRRSTTCGAYVGDTSNLILDTDLDSYYVMDAIVLNLIRSQDLLSVAGSLGKCIVPDRKPTVEERTEFISLASLLRSNAEATNRGLDIAIRNNPAANLKVALEPTMREHLAASAALLHAIDDEVIKVRGDRDPACRVRAARPEEPGSQLFPLGPGS